MTTQEFQLKKMGMAIKAMFGLAAIVASFALLIQSTTPAVADAPETTYEAGRYQMMMTSVMSDNNKSTVYLVVWDSSTGRSRLYTARPGREGMTAANSSYQLPSSPL